MIHKTEDLSGAVIAPPSKSHTHRAVIAASLSEGQSEIRNPSNSTDAMATIDACKTFVSSIKQSNNKLVVKRGLSLRAPPKTINCVESAATIRFMTPIAALAKGDTTLTGETRLLKRPIQPLVDALKQLGVQCSSTRGYPPVKVHGGEIQGGNVSMVGDVSSQFITGLLLACPLAQKNTQIDLTCEPESLPYIQLTLYLLKKYGIKITVSDDYRHYQIAGCQRYRAVNETVIGDFSSASFLLAAGAVTGSKVKLKGLNTTLPFQPDIMILNILERMGVKLKFDAMSVEVLAGTLNGIKIDVRNIPDLVPICAVLGCYAEGETVIYNAGRLRLKESDRLSSMATELSKMGAEISETKEELRINGPCHLQGCDTDSHFDHRIAMACSIAALGAKGETQIHNAECINKSYPNFFIDLAELGGEIKLGQ